MWRITRLKLVNNAFIYSGTGKHEIDLDFNKANTNSKVNLLYTKARCFIWMKIWNCHFYMTYMVLYLQANKKIYLKNAYFINNILSTKYAHYLRRGNGYNFINTYSIFYMPDIIK